MSNKGIEIKHYKVLSLSAAVEPNSVYYVLDQSTGRVKTYITDKSGIPIPLIDLTTIGSVLSLTGTGVTGTSQNPKVDIATFISTQLGNRVYLSSSDGKLQVNPISSPNSSITITATSTELQLQLSAAIQSQISSALQPNANLSGLNNDIGFITLSDISLKLDKSTYVGNAQDLDTRIDVLENGVLSSYAKIVYVNAISPTTATIFDLNNPPSINDNLLKNDITNLYIGTDNSTWVYSQGSLTYETKILSSASNFYLSGSLVDAGNNKTQAIKRNGTIESTGFIKEDGTNSQFLKADGSIDTTAYATVVNLATKVDKITGYSLTKNDFTDILKSKLDSITEIFTTALKASYDSTVIWISTNGTNVISAYNWVTNNGATLLSHLTNTSNPHSTTAAQVGAVAINTPIIGDTKTKITYDAKGLVTAGIDATTLDISDNISRRYVTDAQIASWNAIVGGSVFQTTWNAATNTPTLVSSVGTKGFYYIVSVLGATNLDGIIDWKVGDWVIFDGAIWRKVDNTDAVSSVNSLTGTVLLDSSNVPDTSNKRYITDSEKLAITHTNRTALDNVSGINTGDQDLSIKLDITPDYIVFDTTPETTSTAQGTLNWNTDELTLDLIQNGTTLQLGQELQYNVRNNTAATIPDGTPVMATGSIGTSGRITIAPMDGTNPSNSKFFLGITTELIVNGTDGKVSCFGKIRGINTSSYVDGNILWISPTVIGGLINIEPISPNISMPVAIVVNAHTNGTLFVRVNNLNYHEFAERVHTHVKADITDFGVYSTDIHTNITALNAVIGTNTGDNAVNTLYSGLVSNATHTGDATGATALTVKGINGTLLSVLGTGILKNTTTTGVPSIAIASDFPILNQNTTGTAAGLSSNIAESQVTGLVTDLAGKEPSFSKNTAFNKNFGTVAGTVVQGGTLGSNAYTSTAYLPLTGGTLTGALRTTSIKANGRIFITNDSNYDDLTSTDGCLEFNFSNTSQLGTIASSNRLAGNIPKPLYYSASNHNFLIGAATFASSVTATSFNGSATLTGTPTAPTATVGTNTTQIATTAFVQSVRPYKVYTALLSQSSTTAPTEVVLENNLSGAIAWTRDGIGSYTGTLTGAFTTGKVAIFYGSHVNGFLVITSPTVNTIKIFSNNTTPSQSDGIISNTALEVRVYN